MADAMATQKFHLQKLDVNFPFSASPPEESAMESKEKLIVGVCVLEKKALSSPMTQILDRLRAFGEFDIVMFGDDMILNSPIEKWPICDWLIAFYSTGYPLDKAEAYVELRKPNLVNEITAQRILHDRRNVYQVLEEHEIPTPAFLVVNREDLDQDLPNFREEQDLVEYDGRVIHKPFVEKPVDGDDHNVRIYYPSSAGGGMKELFRKVGNRSSVFHPDIWQVRRSGCYLYEEFMPTGGTDVKVYTVGPDYAHAEARKSPVVDGVVNRSPDGKEVRYPVLLTPAEKAIARVICLAFRQSVCGFDLLRCNGKSYVCDVNGWSFVKNSHKYYDDAAMVLRSMFLGIITPDLLSSARHSLPWGLNRGDVSPGVGDLTIGRGSDFGLQKELRSVIAIIRHGDRTPKQKVKLKVTQERLLHLMMKYNGGKPKSEAKLKSAVQLEELLDICKKLVPLQRPGKDSDSECEDNEHLEKLRHVRAVLEEGGHFSGIYRKVQLKPQAWTTDIREEGEGGDDERPTEALMVLKYGGVLTHAGRKQAEELGRTFRNHMYPGTGDGTGLLRLHSTYRHDLKIYSSDEGRVQMSAAAFAKGLLDLEGQLTPILVSLVSKDSPMLDTLSENANSEMESAKASLYNIIMSTKGRNEEGEPLSPKSRKSPWMMDGSGLPSDALAKMHQLVKLLKKITAQLKEKCKEEEQKIAAGGEVDAEMPPYHEARALGKTNIDVDRIAAGLPCGTEGFLLMFARWKKLERDVYNEKKNKFDISKIPDIYDSAKYDLLHNQHLQIQFLDELYGVAKELADGVIPNEYGINPLQKVRIGSGIARRLLGKILIDLGNTREEAMSAGTPLNRAIAAASLPPISSSADLSKRAEAWKPKKAGAESGKDMAAPREISSQSCRKVSSDDEDKEAQYRLDPKYANVRTPLRHVRTRLYFTSESHIHSVMNVLRYCHLDDNLAGCQPVVAEESLRMLFETKELDYLTHIVFQLYEHTNVPICDPNRFKIEILLSSGAAYSPLEVSPRDQDHTLPVRQPQPLLGDRDLTLQHLEDMLQPFAMPAEDFPPASTPQGFSGLFLKGGNVLERLANLWPFYRSSSHS